MLKFSLKNLFKISLKINPWDFLFIRTNLLFDSNYLVIDLFYSISESTLNHFSNQDFPCRRTLLHHPTIRRTFTKLLLAANRRYHLRIIYFISKAQPKCSLKTKHRFCNRICCIQKKAQGLSNIVIRNKLWLADQGRRTSHIQSRISSLNNSWCL